MSKTDLSVALYRPSAFNLGGTGVYTRRLMEGFATAGIKGVTPVGGSPGGVVSKFFMEHFSIPERVGKGGYDLLHFPAFGGRSLSGIPYSVTVHDMAFMANPRWFPLLRSLYYRLHFPKTAKGASLVIADSDFTSDEIRKYLGIESVRVYLSAPLNNSDEDLFRNRYGIKGKYVIYTGTVEPRKNLSSLLRSWNIVRKVHPAMDLVIAGRWGWGSPKTKTLLTETSGVKWLGPLSNAELSSAVAGAVLMVYPSIYEGFGLPPLEAAAAGVPFVAGPARALREIYGDIAAGFCEKSPDSIAQTILDALDTVSRSDELRDFARGFSNRTMAENTWAAYRGLFQ